MIRIPVFLFVAQWALLAALGLLVVILYRQLGRLLTGSGQAADLGPDVGSLAAALTYVRPGDHVQRTLAPGDGEPAARRVRGSDLPVLRAAGRGARRTDGRR